MMEIWRDIPGFEGLYQVSDLGRVRSVARQVSYKDVTRGVKARELVTFPQTNGYLSVSLWKNGKQKSCLVHHLVAKAHIGPRPSGLQVLHENDCKTDNRLSNLYYGTDSQNKLDAYRNGRLIVRDMSGERNPNQKLTQDQVDAMRTRFIAGEKRKDLAISYGVSLSLVKRIIRGELWTNAL